METGTNVDFHSIHFGTSVSFYTGGTPGHNSYLQLLESSEQSLKSMDPVSVFWNRSDTTLHDVSAANESITDEGCRISTELDPRHFIYELKPYFRRHHYHLYILSFLFVHNNCKISVVTLY